MTCITIKLLRYIVIIMDYIFVSIEKMIVSFNIVFNVDFLLNDNLDQLKCIQSSQHLKYNEEIQN